MRWLSSRKAILNWAMGVGEIRSGHDVETANYLAKAVRVYSTVFAMAGRSSLCAHILSTANHEDAEL